LLLSDVGYIRNIDPDNRRKNQQMLQAFEIPAGKQNFSGTTYYHIPLPLPAPNLWT